ncbi:hypothetical protein ABK046_43750, partial [Streptomyces caeruleatus]
MTGAEHAAWLENFFVQQNVQPGQRPALPPKMSSSTGMHLDNVATGIVRQLAPELAEVLRRHGYEERVVTAPDGRLIFARTRTNTVLTGAEHAAWLENFFAQQNVQPGRRPALPHPKSSSTGMHLSNAAPGKGRLAPEVAAVLEGHGYGDRLVTDRNTGKLHFAPGSTKTVLTGAEHAAWLENFFAQQNVGQGQRPALPHQ